MRKLEGQRRKEKSRLKREAMEGDEIDFERKNEESKMRQELKIQYEKNQDKGNLSLILARERERGKKKKPPTILEEQRVKEGEKEKD